MERLLNAREKFLEIRRDRISLLLKYLLVVIGCLLLIYAAVTCYQHEGLMDRGLRCYFLAAGGVLFFSLYQIFQNGFEIMDLSDRINAINSVLERSAQRRVQDELR